MLILLLPFQSDILSTHILYPKKRDCLQGKKLAKDEKEIEEKRKKFTEKRERNGEEKRKNRGKMKEKERITCSLVQKRRSS